MKKITGIFLIILISSIFGCKREGDVLATYKNGNITRGDFYKWLDVRRFSKETLLKSKSKQKDKIENMAIELITIAKAKAEGFDKTEEFQVFRDISTENILIKRLYDKEIKDKAHFKEPAIKVRQIMLRVKDFEIDPKQKNKRINLSKQEIEKRTNETVAKGKEIIEKLNKGEKFEELAKQFSDDFSKTKGGDIGFIVRSMMPPDFSDAAFSLKKGEYSKEPIKTTRGIYIVKVEDVEELTDKNIEKIIDNKSQAMNIKNGLLRNYSKDYIDKLMGAADVKFFDNKAASKNNADILFKIADKNYTVGNFTKRIELRQYGSDPMNRPKINITDEQRKNMAKSYFQYEILKRDAISKGIDKDPEYLKEMQARTDSIIATQYTNKLFSTDAKVTYNEIKEEYDKNKENRYFKMVNKGDKRVKQPEPFNAVKDRIEKNLLSVKKSEKRKNWTSQMLQEYAFKLNESELEGSK
jgi:parvulin-like peptidyl-prolyl isomerase